MAKKNLTLRLINDPSNNNYQTLSAIFEKAFKTWSDVANIKFTQIRSEGPLPSTHLKSLTLVSISLPPVLCLFYTFTVYSYNHQLKSHY
jgi:hypothetical protein